MDMGVFTGLWPRRTDDASNEAFRTLARLLDNDQVCRRLAA